MGTRPELKHKLIQGGTFVDERGYVSFINKANLINVKRIYTIKNHQTNFIRAWHGHKKESKFFMAISGSFLVGLININNFQNPSKKLKAKKIFLSENNPQILFVPKGYANGIMNLEPNSKLLVFSDMTLLESGNDDYRFAYDYWNIWQIDKK